MTTAGLVLVFVVGLVIGSFLNVIRYRMPRKLSVVKGRSRCPKCGGVIRWYDNIPVVSFILLRRRCRACGWKIPFVYPVIEVATAIVLVLIWNSFPFKVSIAYSVFSVLVIACAATDYEKQIIPDKITFPGMVLGIGFSVTLLRANIGSNPLLHSLLGLLIGGGALLVVGWLYNKVRRIEGIGLGDVTLMAMVGSFLGYRLALLTIFIGSVAGALVGIGVMVKTRQGLKAKIPFGVFLSPAALVCLLAGEDILQAYLRLLRG
ncbi:MAG TPA: prepilin peptidase [Firmicutes bacterium]|nr:prepilin peptidase [Bacillota bacterium]